MKCLLAARGVATQLRDL